MGVEARIVAYSTGPEAAAAAAAAAFARIAAIEDVLTDYRPDSEAVRLTDAAYPDQATVSADLFAVLARSLAISRHTGGAFDPTLGAATALWRETRRTGCLPGPSRLAAALDASGWWLVHLDASSSSVRFGRPGLRLDFGGIGKGYAATEAIAVLEKRGVTSALVSLAGDIVVSQPPPGRSAWTIAVRTGLSGDERMIMLANAAVSTSGDTSQWIEIGGVRYSHILDPATGLGLTRRAAATVVATDGALADSLATALCVAGVDRAAALVAEFPGVRARVEEMDRAGAVRAVELDGLDERAAPR